MPHARNRHVTSLLLKKLKFSPVVAIQGARQTGKSFLVHQLLKDGIPSLAYQTFDQFSVREFAAANPESFLAQYRDARPLAIDEAQKVPVIFDAVKFEVDKLRVPGRFLLLGSTEFSKMTLIRESLTGRLSKVRLFPLNTAETLELSPNTSNLPNLLRERPRIDRAQLMHYLKRGGMPGIFAVRNDAEHRALLHDWLELTASRDAVLFPKLKVDPELCMRMLEKIAVLEEPDAGHIARSLRRDVRRVKTHLQVLSALFVLHRLAPHPAGTGKPLYFLCDVAFSKALGADFERQLYTWLLNEQLSQRSYRGDYDANLYYYRTQKGRKIHLVIESGHAPVSAIKILPEERILERDVELLKAFGKKLGRTKTLLCGLGATKVSFREHAIEVFPWEAMA